MLCVEVVKALNIGYEHLHRRYFLSLIIVEAAIVDGNKSQGQDNNADDSTKASTSGLNHPSSKEDDKTEHEFEMQITHLTPEGE